MRFSGARYLLALAALLPGANAATDRFAGISNGWEYRFATSDSWRPVADLQRADLHGHPGLRLRRNLPDIGARNTALVFTGFVPRLSVSADDAQVYEYNNSSGRLLHVATIHTIPLPPGSKEVEISIPRIVSDSFGIENPYVAAIESVPAVIQRLVNEPLRRDLPYIVIGLLTLAGGLALVTLFFVRRRTRNLAWIYLGVASVLYGARLLMDSQWISFLIGYPGYTWRWPIAFVTYTIGIPAVLLARSALGPGWKSSLHWMLGVQIAFSVAAICSDLLQSAPMSLVRLNAAWALVFTLVVLANMLRRRLTAVPGRRGLAFGFVLFAATVANANMTAVGLPGWRPWGLQLEPYGFVTLLGAFAWFVARQAFTREEKLLAVEHELETARSIQQSILPRKIPSISRLEIAARYIPMTAVAGDFYDFIQVDSDRLGILVADVSGHGVPAALVASMVKIAFAGQSGRAADPAGVLSGMNEVLHGRVQRQFVTAVYTFIDTAERTIVYASAGHPWPLLHRKATRKVEALKQGGLVLGPFRKTPYVNSRVPFEPGDRLLLYTDGIIEAANSGDELFGDHLLQEFIGTCDLPAERFTDELLKEVHRWSANQGDDLTIVTMDHIG